jgi:hypothetical protein
MLKRIRNLIWDSQCRQRVTIALAKASVAMPLRRVDLTAPGTWEFSGFSQNGEDGVIEVLRQKLRSANRYFVEIGVADGLENNTAWLAIVEKYNGLMIDGDERQIRRAQRALSAFSIGIDCRHAFVTRDNAPEMVSSALHRDPDVFSLDIDGNDLYVMRALLDAGLRPKIVVVEYNSAFGPDRSVTIEYRADFDRTKAHPSWLYYGASIAGWRRFFEGRGYRFVTVDRNGANAFFVDPAHFDAGFLDGVRGLEFAENAYQLLRFRVPNSGQLDLIAGVRFVDV